MKDCSNVSVGDSVTHKDGTEGTVLEILLNGALFKVKVDSTGKEEPWSCEDIVTILKKSSPKF